MSTNIDGFLNKRDEFNAFLKDKNPDIISITETIAKRQTQFNESEYQLPGYKLFLSPRQERGVALYIKETLNPMECDTLTKFDFVESTWAQFIGGNEQKVLVGCIYKSPNTTEDNTKKLYELMRHDMIQTFDCVCILGDFNFPTIDWLNMTWTNSDNDFIESLRDSYLQQVVTKPTRRRDGQKANILDLVIVNDDSLVSEITHNSPFGKSDHEVLTFSLYVKNMKPKEESQMKYNWKKGN